MRKLNNEQNIVKNWRKDTDLPLVSICCITYNHESYIEDTLEGFLMQKTNFFFEILICDDASLDGTADIIREYEAAYPRILKPIYQSVNQYSQGVKINKTFNFPRAKGKYIALCEGDDYWTDPCKLQKQIDFLEANPHFMGCAHNTKIINLQTNKESYIVNNSQKDIFTIDDFTKGEAYFHTSSWVYRYDRYRDKINETQFEGDWFLSMIFTHFGPIKYIDEVMSVYRIHDKGIWSKLTQQEQIIKNLDVILKMNKVFEYKYEGNLMLLFTRSLTNNLKKLEVENILLFLEDLDKSNLLIIIIKFCEEILRLQKLVDEKEEYIDEKHKIITWYEDVVKELQKSNINLNLEKN